MVAGGSPVGRKAKKELRHRANRARLPTNILQAFLKDLGSENSRNYRLSDCHFDLSPSHRTPGRRYNSILNFEVSFTGNGFNETISQKYSRHQNVFKILGCSTQPPGSVAESDQRSNVVLHNRQWIIILVVGETPRSQHLTILTTVTDRLVSPHPSNAGCT